MTSLETLRTHRDALLLAELGALLHNLGKLSQRFVAGHTADSGFACARHFNYEYIVGLAAAQIAAKRQQFADARSAPARTAAETAAIEEQQRHLEGAIKRLDRDEQTYAKRNPNWVTEQSAAGVNATLLGTYRDVFRSVGISLPPPLNDREPYLLGDFIEYQNRDWYPRQAVTDPAWHFGATELFGSSFATWLLQRAHDTASGGEKEGSRRAMRPERQAFAHVAMTTAFGTTRPLETRALAGLRTALLDQVVHAVEDIAARRGALWREAEQALKQGAGDTRLPINDVTVWDLGSSAAALFKAGAAQLILEGPADPAAITHTLWTMQWRLLSVRLDGMAFLGRAHHVTDLLGRQQSLTDALNRIRHELEIVYPLGNEVYRDENGSVFVVPDVEHLLTDYPVSTGDGQVDLGQYLRLRFDGGSGSAEQRIADFAGEVDVTAVLSPAGAEARLTLEPALTPPPPLAARPEQVEAWWRNADRTRGDLCTVCQVRPQGFGAPDGTRRDRAQARNVCYVCLQRRLGRSERWAKGVWERARDPDRRQDAINRMTVWTDEATDANGRVALVVGRFDLDPWLDGTLIRTLAVGFGQNGTVVDKNPSFARIRRVWETTEEFWRGIATALAETVGQTGPRLRIEGAFERATEAGDQSRGRFNVYELGLDGRSLSVVWDDGMQSFITADNLSYLARQLGAPEEGARTPRAAAAFIQERLLQRSQREPLPLDEPGGYNARAKRLGTLRHLTVEAIDGDYIPAIPLLRAPRSFLAIVPAARALDVAAHIAAEYDGQMARVRNRLRLDLGMVYFPRRTPLPAVLDAGRRMLALPSHPERWAVADDAQEDGDAYTVTFTNGVTWSFPRLMGNGETADIWYPYFTPVTSNDHVSDHVPANLVHVKHLTSGQHVWVRPSRFDFEYLDTPARRLLLSYDEHGRRQDEERRQRPFWLEELKSLRALWSLLDQDDGVLSNTQLHALVALIETKRVTWRQGRGPAMNPTVGDPFTRLIDDALVQAGNGWWRSRSVAERELLCWGALRGWLADVAALNLSIANAPSTPTRTQEPATSGGAPEGRS